MEPRGGFEPPTSSCLESCEIIAVHYQGRATPLSHRGSMFPFIYFWRARRDSNPRHPG